jgi:hypothetical protein
VDESGSSSHDEEIWSSLIAKVVTGNEDEEAVWAFRFAVERRVWNVVLSGRQNDPDSAQVKSPFRNLFRDPHAAEDFIAEFVEQIDRSRAKGRYRDDAFLGLTRSDALKQIAAKDLIRKRAISSVRKFSRGGITGLPDDASNPVSYDGGLDGGWGDQVGDSTSAEEGISDSGMALILRLQQGEPVLDLQIKGDRLAAVEETAALQTWVLLDQGRPSFGVIRVMVEGKIVGGIPALQKAHVDGQQEIEDSLADCVTEIERHPAMELRRLDGIDRRRARLEARRIFEPLSASAIRDLLALPSLNAGEKRNSKYRSGVAGLFPQFDELLQAMELVDEDGESTS